MDNPRTAGDGFDRRAIFWICVLALLSAAMSFSLRTGASGAIKAALFDPVDPLHSGEMIATALGNSFLGFALTLLVISPILDIVGARRVILLASVCYIVGPLLIIASPHAGAADAVYQVLTIGMVLCGVAWGATEASINPVTAALYPDDKTHRLNVLHAWWPAGIVAGGLWSVLVFEQFHFGWQAAIGLICVPGVVFGLWALTQKFPHTESTSLGVPFRSMLVEPFKRPSFWIFPGDHVPHRLGGTRTGFLGRRGPVADRGDAGDSRARLRLGDHVHDAPFRGCAGAAHLRYGAAVRVHRSGGDRALPAEPGLTRR